MHTRFVKERAGNDRSAINRPVIVQQWFTYERSLPNVWRSIALDLFSVAIWTVDTRSLGRDRSDAIDRRSFYDRSCSGWVIQTSVLQHTVIIGRIFEGVALRVVERWHFLAALQDTISLIYRLLHNAFALCCVVNKTTRFWDLNGVYIWTIKRFRQLEFFVERGEGNFSLSKWEFPVALA